MAFRDDREALLARVTALESELGEQRGGEARQALLEELDALRAQVRTATGELEQDRGALREVAAALDRLRARVAPEPAQVAAVEPAEVPARARQRSGLTVAVIGIGIALVAAAIILMSARSKRAPSSAVPPAARESREVEAREMVAEPPPVVVAPEASVEPASARIDCVVVSTPAGATLSRAGVKLGKTPLRISVQDGDDARGLLLHLNGFRDVELELVPTAPGCRIDVVMQQQGPQ